MLYQAIRLGCQKYHASQYNYDVAYRRYLYDRDADKWNNPETLDFTEVNRLVKFANQWKCRMPAYPSNVQNIQTGLRRALPHLNLLRDKTLLDVDLNSGIRDTTVGQLVSMRFHEIAISGKRFESVATSKMIHAAINPNLFVMWDNRIREGYGISGNRGRSYILFLKLMQNLAETAIQESIDAENLTREDAIISLTPRGHTLAKAIDEFNYVLFTEKDSDARQLVCAGYP